MQTLVHDFALSLPKLAFFSGLFKVAPLGSLQTLSRDREPPLVHYPLFIPVFFSLLVGNSDAKIKILKLENGESLGEFSIFTYEQQFIIGNLSFLKIGFPKNLSTFHHPSTWRLITAVGTFDLVFCETFISHFVFSVKCIYINIVSSKSNKREK